MECHSYDALIIVPTAMFEKWFELGILRLIHSMNVNPVLALVPVGRVVEAV